MIKRNRKENIIIKKKQERKYKDKIKDQSKENIMIKKKQ